MFSTAFGIATRYTFPVVSSYRLWDGRIGTSLGAFVAVNADGWIVTAGHTFNLVSQAADHAREIDTYRKGTDDLRANPNLAGKHLASRIRRAEEGANKDWITSYSYWWAADNVTLADLRVIPEADLAVARLDPPISLDPGHYPVFKDPSQNFGPGTSLCRLGFPFSSVQVSFDDAAGTFAFDPSSLTFFPSEGMFARLLLSDDKDPDGQPISFIETSSPGLRGQSGGPIFDVHGRIWAVQCQTRTMELGFNPETMVKGKMAVAPQFISLGVGTSDGTILSVLRDMGVACTVSPD